MLLCVDLVTEAGALHIPMAIINFAILSKNAERGLGAFLTEGKKRSGQDSIHSDTMIKKRGPWEIPERRAKKKQKKLASNESTMAGKELKGEKHSICPIRAPVSGNVDLRHVPKASEANDGTEDAPYRSHPAIFISSILICPSIFISPILIWSIPIYIYLICSAMFCFAPEVLMAVFSLESFRRNLALVRMEHTTHKKTPYESSSTIHIYRCSGSKFSTTNRFTANLHINFHSSTKFWDTQIFNNQSHSSIH